MPNVRDISEEIIASTMNALQGMLHNLGNTMKLTVGFNNVPDEAIESMKELTEYLQGAKPIIEKLAFAQAKAIKNAENKILTVKTGVIH
jgi:hypothetical protein